MTWSRKMGVAELPVWEWQSFKVRVSGTFKENGRIQMKISKRVEWTSGKTYSKI